MATFWQKPDASGLHADLTVRLRRRLEALHRATRPEDMNFPGFSLHRLHGQPVRYIVHVNGPWCLTFEWDGEDSVSVDLEQYH
ncbi:MAG: type II toxin-antitoxin system RelE/ParE family toxin [Acetobacteraceae bacterium]